MLRFLSNNLSFFIPLFRYFSFFSANPSRPYLSHPSVARTIIFLKNVSRMDINIWQHGKLLGVLTPHLSPSFSKYRPVGLVLKLGSVKAKGREPKPIWVFNYKLGSYDDVHVMWTHANSYS
jgi:hypothetical protein